MQHFNHLSDWRLSHLLRHAFERSKRKCGGLSQIDDDKCDVV
jgi:hypothetical protein